MVILTFQFVVVVATVLPVKSQWPCFGIDNCLFWKCGSRNAEGGLILSSARDVKNISTMQKCREVWSRQTVEIRSRWVWVVHQSMQCSTGNLATLVSNILDILPNQTECCAVYFSECSAAKSWDQQALCCSLQLDLIFFNILFLSV